MDIIASHRQVTLDLLAQLALNPAADVRSDLERRFVEHGRELAVIAGALRQLADTHDVASRWLHLMDYDATARMITGLGGVPPRRPSRFRMLTVRLWVAPKPVARKKASKKEKVPRACVICSEAFFPTGRFTRCHSCLDKIKLERVAREAKRAQQAEFVRQAQAEREEALAKKKEEARLRGPNGWMGASKHNGLACRTCANARVCPYGCVPGVPCDHAYLGYQCAINMRECAPTIHAYLHKEKP